MTNQITILSSSTQSDGSFSVSGAFWLTAPSNAIVANPTLRSQVPSASITDLASLRAGTIVEQPFTSGLFASGTLLTAVQSSLQTQYATAQTALNNTNPPLANLVGSAYNGTIWATITTVIPTLPSSNFNIPIIMDSEFAAATGLLPNVVSSRATGYIATSTLTGLAIRATAYAPQGTNAQRSIKSSSINDATGGTGALTLVINYLNTSFQLKQDTINLNGTTAVNTNATDIAFIESLVVGSVGTQGGGNLGTISLFTATAGGGSVWASIAVSDNVTYYAHHYVPTGVTCYLLNVFGGATGAIGRVTVNHSGNPSSTTIPQLGIGGTYTYLAGGNADHEFTVPIAIPGPDFIWLVTTPAAASPSTSYGTFEYLQY